MNKSLGLRVKQNPIEPCFKRLVEIVKHCREEEKDMDELTLMELLEPVRRVADVKAMAEYMGIDAKNESHLLWIAKMAVLDDLPDGWREEILPTRRRRSTRPTAHTAQVGFKQRSNLRSQISGLSNYRCFGGSGGGEQDGREVSYELS